MKCEKHESGFNSVYFYNGHWLPNCGEIANWYCWPPRLTTNSEVATMAYCKADPNSYSDMLTDYYFSYSAIQTLSPDSEPLPHQGLIQDHIRLLKTSQEVSWPKGTRNQRCFDLLSDIRCVHEGIRSENAPRQITPSDSIPTFSLLPHIMEQQRYSCPLSFD